MCVCVCVCVNEECANRGSIAEHVKQIATGCRQEVEAGGKERTWDENLMSELEMEAERIQRQELLMTLHGRALSSRVTDYPGT